MNKLMKILTKKCSTFIVLLRMIETLKNQFLITFISAIKCIYFKFTTPINNNENTIQYVLR